MELLDAIKQELDRHLAGSVRPEAYQAYLDAISCCMRGKGQMAYLRRLSGGSKGGDQE